MSVKNENAAGGESVVLERPAAGGVYASLFKKINLNPVSELSALDIWQDAQAMAEQYGRNELALHLLGELTASAPQLTLSDWEPGLLFDVLARRLRLLRMKAGRSESDKARFAPEMDSLLAGLIALDPARAMVLCG